MVNNPPAMMSWEFPESLVLPSNPNSSLTLKDLQDWSVMDTNKYFTVVQETLRPKIVCYLQTVRELVQHREQGTDYFREAAEQLDSHFKKVSAAKIVGSVAAVGGGMVSIVGGGLLLGGVTAPLGIALLVTGAGVGAAGGITGAGASIGDLIHRKREIKRANQWIHDGRELCLKLIRMYDDLETEINKARRLYPEISVDDLISDCLNVDVDQFKEPWQNAGFTIKAWKDAIEIGTQGVADTFATGTRVVGAAVVGTVEATTEVGAAVSRVGVAAAGVAVGLSAAFMVVDLLILAKTAHGVWKSKGKSELGNNLRAAADDFELETEELKGLAKLNV